MLRLRITPSRKHGICFGWKLVAVGLKNKYKSGVGLAKGFDFREYY